MLGGQKVNLPTALKTGPVPSQPTADDYAARTGSVTISTPGKAAAPPENDSGLFWLMLGIALAAILTLVGLSLLIVRNRRREAALYRFRRQPDDLEEIDVYSRLSSSNQQSQTPLPAAPSPVARMPLPPAPMPVRRSLAGSCHLTANLPPGGAASVRSGQPGCGLARPPSAAKPDSGPGPPRDRRLFNFSNARPNPKAPGATTYSAGAFLDIDPYGLNFEPLNSEAKEKQV